MNEKQLIEELLKLNIKLTNNQLNQLKQYYELLVEENNKYNSRNHKLKQLGGGLPQWSKC